MRNECDRQLIGREICLLKEKVHDASQQGGTYDQYHRWLGKNPDDVGAQPLDPCLVWRSGGDE